MEKESCQIKCTEIENGVRIEVTGANLKDKISRCCIPLTCFVQKQSSSCCPPEKERQD